MQTSLVGGEWECVGVRPWFADMTTDGRFVESGSLVGDWRGSSSRTCGVLYSPSLGCHKCTEDPAVALDEKTPDVDPMLKRSPFMWLDREDNQHFSGGV